MEILNQNMSYIETIIYRVEVVQSRAKKVAAKHRFPTIRFVYFNDSLLYKVCLPSIKY